MVLCFRCLCVVCLTFQVFSLYFQGGFTIYNKKANNIMSCTNRVINGIQCHGYNERGGITDVLIGFRFKTAPFFSNPDSGEIDRIWEDSDKDSGEWDDRFRYFAINPQSGSFTSTMTSREDGVEYCEETINIQFASIGGDRRNELHKLLRESLMMAVRTKKGKWMIFGMTEAVRLESVVVESGQNSPDFNGYKCVFKCFSDMLTGNASWAFAHYLDDELRRLKG